MSQLFRMIIVIAFLLNVFTPSNSQIGAAMGVISIALGIIQFEYDVSNVMSTSRTLHSLQENIQIIHNKIQLMSSEISGSIDRIPELLKQQLRLHDLQKYRATIQSLYKRYETFSKNITHIEKRSLLEFADTVISSESLSVEDMLDQIHALILPPKRRMEIDGTTADGILYLFATSVQKMKFAEHCQLMQSPYQIVNNYYGDIALIQLQGCIMKLFGYAILKLFNEGNFTYEIELFKEKQEANIKQQIKVLKHVLQSVSRVIWRCDPNVHVKDKTYLEVTQLLQGYIQSEGDLTSIDTCSDSCTTLRKETRSFGCQEKLCCSQRKCQGTVRDCTNYPGSKLLVCLGDNGNSRRYSNVLTELPGGIAGNEKHKYGKECPDHNSVVTVENWWRVLVTCDYCFCLCDEESEHSDRYFNLRPVMADIKNNRVITGLRFVKHNRIIHLQIQEGKLLPGGSIDNSSVRWVPVKDYKLNDEHITNGQDYHTLDGNRRGVNLDDVLSNKGDILIGVRLITIKAQLSLSIAATSFNVSTGILTVPEGEPQWITSDSTERDTLHLTDPDLSYSIRSSSVPTSTNPSYIQFTNTDWKKDVAQNTVPSLDAQPVASEQSIPLGGAGLYHRGQNGYGGFLALRIMTYDFGHHL